MPELDFRQRIRSRAMRALSGDELESVEGYQQSIYGQWLDPESWRKVLPATTGTNT